jgi:ssDNA-binding Zn-finger/Zn-ribbon topoisomerase 1
VIPYLTPNDIREKATKNGYDSSDDIDFFQGLIQDFPEYRLIFGRKFAFRPPKTVVIGPSEPFSRLLALHELGHAICKHKHFRMDVERLKMENQAWEEARRLALPYEVKMDEDLIQNELHTYRDWLHQKSRCPICGLTRFQTPDSQYHCPRCEEFISSQGHDERYDHP